MCNFCIAKCRYCESEYGVPWGEGNRGKWSKCWDKGVWPETNVQTHTGHWEKGTVYLTGVRRRHNPGGKTCFSPSFNPGFRYGPRFGTKSKGKDNHEFHMNNAGNCACLYQYLNSCNNAHCLESDNVLRCPHVCDSFKWDLRSAMATDICHDYTCRAAGW